MEVSGTNASGNLAADLVKRSVESLNGVVQQATDAEQALSEKMIHANAEEKVRQQQEEGVGRALNLMA